MKKGQDIAIVGFGETKITLRGSRSPYDLAAEVLDVKAEDVKIGMKIKVYWEKLSDEINYPAFELV